MHNSSYSPTSFISQNKPVASWHFPALKQYLYSIADKWAPFMVLIGGFMLIFVLPQGSYQLFGVELNGINFSFHFRINPLAKLMLVYLNIIGVVIYAYSHRYLLSDPFRNRFLMQIALTILCVMGFILSANLLTAFITWQCIGFNLHLLLNHYGFLPASRLEIFQYAVIRWVGNVAFLLAVILSYYFYGTTEFQLLDPSVYIHENKMSAGNLAHYVIMGLILMTVMIRSALFPFHRWLSMTMQAPTPVSALMHGGVINAGVLLLIKLNPLLTHALGLSYAMLAVGLATMAVGAYHKSNQSHIKGQLVYSTISQMGYLFLQQALGCFSGAIFHLIAHGFYKAYLFLNTGEILQAKRNQTWISNSQRFYVMLALGVTIALMAINMTFFREIDIPVLLVIFIGITLNQMIYSVLCRGASLYSKALFLLLMEIIIIVYCHILYRLENILSPDLQGFIANDIQILLAGTILIAYGCWFWRKGNGGAR